jgi:transcriptional regulator with XRE-family HTH domain
MFDLVGETLRRLRKERHMTLAQLGGKAGLGRGQLSRIENGHQEATLKTLAKILGSQGVSRRDFFRRYDLVENETVQVERAHEAAGDAYPPASGAAALPGEIRETLGRVESLMKGIFAQSQTLAQGAIELGDYVVLFRVVPRNSSPGEPPLGAPPQQPPEPPTPFRRPGRRGKR